jgi:hypothetical protein
MWTSTGFSAWITNVPVLHVNVYRILSLNYKCTCFTCERLQDSQLELEMYVFYMWTSTGFSAWITNVRVLHVNVHRILSLNYKCTCFTCERPQDFQRYVVGKTWRYQRDIQKTQIEEGQIIQWPKEKGQTTIYKTLNRKLKIGKHEPPKKKLLKKRLYQQQRNLQKIKTKKSSNLRKHPRDHGEPRSSWRIISSCFL